MAPKAKPKVPTDLPPPTLVPVPIDGSAPIDLSQVVEAIYSDNPRQHEAVAETVKILPRSTLTMVRSGEQNETKLHLLTQTRQRIRA
jgi:hypothetical protein